MKQKSERISRSAVVRCLGQVEVAVDTPVGECGPGDVVVEWLASPINPADQLEIDGTYAGARTPFTPGAEGVGRIVERGVEVRDLQEGDLVLHLTRGNWRHYRRVAQEQVVLLPASIDVHQAAMLRVNPATAALLLSDVLPLQAGDTVVVNAANSSVGRLLFEMGRPMGLTMVAVLREGSEPSAWVREHAHHIAFGNEHLAATLLKLTGGKGARLALDCVAGPSSARLAMGLATGGTLCVYGHLSGQDCHVPSRQLTFGQVRVRGFNLGHALAGRTHAEVTALYSALAERSAKGELHTPIAATHALDEVAAAVDRAGKRAGAKILLTPRPEPLETPKT